MGPIKKLAAVSAMVLVAGCSSGGRISQASVRKASGLARPNIVFVLVDDLDYASYLNASRFPVMHKLLVDAGTSFSNYFVTDSLCCPSRAAILRGQYVHNTGVLSNVPPTGGFTRFHKLGNEKSTVATWLHKVGYHTALIGKYLNGYARGVDRTYIPPGWDDFDSPTDLGNPYAEYNYQLNDNGRLETHIGIKPKSYLVDVLTRKSRQFLLANAGKRPFFLYVAPYVPHEPATPARRYQLRFPGARAPRPPSYNERDLSAEPQWLRDLPMIDAERRIEIDGLYQRRLESMLGVEDMLRTIVNTLQRTGQLDNTYIVFTSDNGFHLGEHRLPAGKQTAYDEDIHVPLVVRGPGVPADHTVTQFVNETDLAPTLADLAHARIPAFVDGASFAADLDPDGTAALPKDTLIEHYATAADDFTGELPKNEPDDDAHPPVEGAPQSGPAAPRQVRFASVRIPSYRALRTPDYLYVEYLTGEKQLYDLRTDPYELHNLAATADHELLRSLAHRLLQLANCEGPSCRT